MFKSAKRVITFLVLLVGLFAATGFVLAADLGTNYAANIGLGNSDPRVMVANIVRIALAFLGILALAIIVYGGFLWMTANGDESKIETAKKLLVSAIIGLVIILSAFGIASFVLGRLMDATGTSTTTGGGGGSGTIPGTGGVGANCDLNTLTPVCDPDNSACLPGLVCDGSSCTCQPGGGAGSPCDGDVSTPVCDADNLLCLPSLFCDAATSCTCQPRGGAGASCDSNPATPTCEAAATCASGLFCDVTNPTNPCTCQPGSGVGQACDKDQSTPACEEDQTVCSNDLTCDTSSSCTCQDLPVVKWISPQGGFCDNNRNQICQTDAECPGSTCNKTVPNAAPGNIIAIGGRYFGNTPGEVRFWDGTDFNVTGTDPKTANPQCDANWKDDQIVVVVPSGAANGPIRVIRAGDRKSDDTNNAYGPRITDLAVNTIRRPGLCKLDPDHARLDQTVNYYGLNVSGGSARFGTYLASVNGKNSSFSTPLSGSADVPGLQSGPTTSFADVPGAGKSNYLSFTKDEEVSAGSFISSFEPSAGRSGQYVTISGSGFGFARGTSQVFFGPESADIEASYTFPEICADSVWSDKQVIVKVPDGIANANYIITMVVGGKTIDTAKLRTREFRADSSLSLAPSLCRLAPAMGQADTPVTLWGEYFDDFDNANSKVRFTRTSTSYQEVAGAANLTFWGVDAAASGAIKPYKIETKVPVGAATGPVRVVKGASSLAGNGLNFSLGSCLEASDPDNACGSGQVCCAAGTYKAGRCQASVNDCSIDIETSVYEWDFNTGAAGAYGSCVEMSRDLGICSLVTCPNSAGQCSPYRGGGTEETGACTYSCNGVRPCTNNCSYDSGLDRCLVNSGRVNCDLPAKVKNVFNNDVDAVCVDYKGSARRAFYLSTNESCPTGWTMDVLAGESGVMICVNTSASCSLCDSGFVCLANGSSGVCAAPSDICPDGSTCQNDNKCKKSDSAACNCCCRIANSTEDCCAGLRCAGTCGSDATDDGAGLGRCGGCTREDASGNIDVAASDAACNCTKTTGKYCDTTAGKDSNNDGHPDGVCGDCAELPDNGACTGHNTTCCVDATKGNLCTGLKYGDKTTDVFSLFSSGGVSYCGYYECNAGNKGCSETLVSAPIDSTRKYFPALDSCVKECGASGLGEGNNPGKSCDSTGAASLGGGNYLWLANNIPNNAEEVYFDDLVLNKKASPANIAVSLWDTGFENNISGWSAVNNTSISRPSGSAKGGNYSLRVKRNDTTGGGGVYYNLGALESGATYILSGFYKTAVLNAEFSNKVTLNAAQPWANGTVFKDLSLPGTNNVWQAFSIEFTAVSLSGAKTANKVCDILHCSSPYGCMTAGAGDSSCGNCCCDPSLTGTDKNNPSTYDKCQDLDLSCYANKSSCSGANRGLCCGCKSNSSCVAGGGAATTVGCGTDSCCDGRPRVAATVPASEAGNICTNAQIEVQFDKRMDTRSFAGNFILVGEYSGACPSDTVYIASESGGYMEKSKVQRLAYQIYHAVRDPLVNFFNPEALAQSAPASRFNYCAINGTVSNEARTVDNQPVSVLIFRPQTVLAPAQKYFAILKGDANLDNSLGVKSLYGIGFNGFEQVSGNSPIDPHAKFNGLYFSHPDSELSASRQGHSYIWSFATRRENSGDRGVCRVDRLALEPASYLFKTHVDSSVENDNDPSDKSFDSEIDKDKVFNGKALSSEGQVLSPLPGVYDWTWNFSLVNAVAQFETVSGLDGNRRLVSAADNITDSRTALNASIKIASPSVVTDLPANNNAVSDIYVFICENPWPGFASGGTWVPWRDTPLNCRPGTGTCLNTNYELYYCRDAGAAGTVDDLPPFSSDITRGLVGAPPSYIKESYFFREGTLEAAVPDLLVSTSSPVGTPTQGNRLYLSWPAPSDATVRAAVSKYKIYYGEKSGQPYVNSETVELRDAPYNTGMPIVFGDLTNGKKYYFALTMVYNNGTESTYSTEASASPRDTQPPAKPQNLKTKVVSETAPVSITLVGYGSDKKIGLRFNTLANAEDLIKMISSFTASSTSPSIGNQIYAGIRPVDVLRDGQTFILSNPGITTGAPYRFKIFANYKSGRVVSSTIDSITLNNVKEEVSGAALSLSVKIPRQINVSWDANTDDAVGYRLKYGNSHFLYGSILEKKGKDKNSGVIEIKNIEGLYYITVTAVDAVGNESPIADEAIIAPMESEYTFKNALTNVSFEDASAGGAPADWQRNRQAKVSMGVVDAMAFSGQKSMRIAQATDVPYPGVCSSDLRSMKAPEYNSYPYFRSLLPAASGNSCIFSYSPECPLSNNTCTVSEGASLILPYTNRVSWGSLVYNVSNLGWKPGKKYMVAFYYRGRLASNLSSVLGYSLGWTTQCLANVTGNCSSYWGSGWWQCSANASRCCHLPGQTDCYQAVSMTGIPAGDYTNGPYKGDDGQNWYPYSYIFTYTPGLSRNYDSTGSVRNEIGLAIGYNPTGKYNTTAYKDTDFYIDSFIVAEEGG